MSLFLPFVPLLQSQRYAKDIVIRGVEMISLLCKMAQDALPEIERRLAANAQASRQSQRKRNKQESEMEEESEAEEKSEDNEEDKTWE